MNFRFYLGISIAVIIGLFFAGGVVNATKFAFNFIKSNSYAVYESSADLGARQISDLSQLSSDKKTFIKTNKEAKYNLIENHQKFPKISAQAYLVADLETGHLIEQKNRDQKYPIASLTKLMTALVSLETIDQDDQTMVSYRAVNTYGKQGNLYSGQKILISDLLYPLLLESSNDAAEVLAEHSGHNFFMANLNGKARSIGLINTFFDDPSGLSAENVSTVDELFKLAQYIDRTNSEIFEITRLKDYQGEENTWFNISDFRNDSYYYGGKNGYTDEAYHTLVSIFDLPLNNKENRRIAIILLRSSEPEDDARSVIKWLLKNVYYE